MELTNVIIINLLMLFGIMMGFFFGRLYQIERIQKLHYQGKLKQYLERLNN